MLTAHPTRTSALAVAVAVLTSLLTPAGAAAQSGGYQQTLDIAFPTVSTAYYSDTYDACRDGCSRRHKATDLIGEKHDPLYATVDGTVCRINDEQEEAHYGRHLTLCGDDGRRYRYLHINNDTPGTDDGQADLEHVYAPGIHAGQRVARGQLLARMGDSGAESTVPHLHLDIFDDAVVDPYGDNRINPYPSLQAARARGDYPDGTDVHVEPAGRIAGPDRVATAVAISKAVYEQADTVVVAPSTVPADALTAAPLAAKVGGPVLPTPPDLLPDAILTEIGRLGATRALIVGGRVTAQVAGALTDAGLDVERVGGATRFDTAANVAKLVWGEDEGPRPPDGGLAGDPLPDGYGPEGDGGSGHAPDDPDRFRLAVSTASDRSEPVDLDGATISTDTYMFLAGADLSDVDTVTFHLGERDGTPDGYERRQPFDFPGTGQHVDIGALPSGTSTLHATVSLASGTTVRVDATFETVSADTVRGALLAAGQHPDPSRAWPDALMAAHLGAATGTPVLLASPQALPEETSDALVDVEELTVVGGSAAIADDVVNAAEAAASLHTPARRLAGPDRYVTGLRVAEQALDSDAVSLTQVWAATGRNWPDALAAGPAAAHAGHVLMLIDGAGGYQRDLGRWLADRSDHIDAGTVVGGEAAVTGAAADMFALNLS